VENDRQAATASQFKAVKRLLGEASELVIATDADREGEMIARELVEHCRYRGPIQRLWLSALDDASIRKALAALKPGAKPSACTTRRWAARGPTG
jgi:DNA topoisomerase-3